ncbi:MAG: ATP-dependent DNA helicase RecG [Candidatus Gribaldobacteria bacterium]|nr:ATP-dependent DNA helicase RecG [Candidatus Gribaldobacteria bacterium]
MQLDSSIQYLAGVGPILFKKLQRLKIETMEDLLFYFPTRYEDFSQIVPISRIKPNQLCTVQGKILEIKAQQTWKKKMSLTQAVLQDESGAIEIVWFGQPYLIKSLKAGDFITTAGKAVVSKNGFYLSNPVYEKLDSSPSQNIEMSSIHSGRLVPIYPETAGLPSRWFRSAIYRLLQTFSNQMVEILPNSILQGENLMPVSTALWQIHFPDNQEQAQKAKTRFSFEELFLVELVVLQQRYRLNKEKSPCLPFNLELTKKIVDSLPFKLTDSQRKCAYQIFKDLEKTRPMSRLLEGDVGSGKTVVAVMAALNTIKNGYQAALMAPTEILAKQHFQSVARLLKPFKIKIALLTGKDDKIISQKLGHESKDGYIPDTLEISRSKILEKAKGKINPRTKDLEVGIDFLIGTHSLIQDKVKFGKLGLVIIDEQHRFGVEQRSRLVANKKGADSLITQLLSLPATTIPGTLALTIYGDLDLSVLDQMPQGRKPVITKIIAPTDRQEAYCFIKQLVKKGEQVFVVCPRIEPPKTENSELKPKTPWSEAKAVKEEYEKLSKEIFPDLKVGMLHGKMKTKEKDKIMQQFKNKKIEILVATSVIEVGVDIPQATVMMIEGAERFGLAQLHQFRGRVGRSDLQSYCLLFTESSAQATQARMKALVTAKNGFELAEKDLEIRGPGSLFGAKQWGIPDLAMEQLKHLPFVEKVRESAKEILQFSPQLKKFPLLGERVKRFGKKIHLE